MLSFSPFPEFGEFMSISRRGFLGSAIAASLVPGLSPQDLNAQDIVQDDKVQDKVIDNAAGPAQASGTAKRPIIVVEVIDTVVGADDDRPLRGAGCLGGAGSIVDNFILNFVVLNYVLRVQILRAQTGDERCSDCGT